MQNPVLRPKIRQMQAELAGDASAIAIMNSCAGKRNKLSDFISISGVRFVPSTRRSHCAAGHSGAEGLSDNQYGLPMSRYKQRKDKSSGTSSVRSPSG